MYIHYNLNPASWRIDFFIIVVNKTGRCLFCLFLCGYFVGLFVCFFHPSKSNFPKLKFIMLTAQLSCFHRSLQVKIHLICFWKKEKQPFDRLRKRNINFKCLSLASLIHMRFQKKCVIKIRSHAGFFVVVGFPPPLQLLLAEENSIWIFVDQNDANL